MIKKARLLFFLLFSISLVFYGQNKKYETKLTYKKEELEINYCGANNSFTLNITGKKIKQIESDNNQYFFSVDDEIIQATIIPLNEIFPNLKKRSSYNLEEQKNVLINYMNYELEYYANSLGTITAKYKTKFVNLNNCLIWKFSNNENNQQLDSKYDKSPVGQVFISRICFDHILTLNIPLFEKQSEKKAIKKLKVIANSIEVLETPCLIK